MCVAWFGAKNEIQLGPKIEKFGAPSPRKLVGGVICCARSAPKNFEGVPKTSGSLGK